LFNRIQRYLIQQTHPGEVESRELRSEIVIAARFRDSCHCERRRNSQLLC
jgi:hypothetical protein